MKFNLNAENIDYIKIIYVDKDNFSHCTKAGIKRLGEKEIYASAKFEEDMHIETPQDIALSFVSANGLYKATSVLKYIQTEEPYTYFGIKTPEEVEYYQKREFFRVKLNEDVIITYFDELQQKKEFSCETYDISANGVKVIMDKLIDFPEDVRLDLILPSRHISLDAHYVRSEQEDGLNMASFNFENIKDIDRDYLSQICIKKQLEERRKQII